MKLCFLTIGDMSWASSRIKSYWPIRYLPEGSMAMQWKNDGPDIPTEGFDAYIWMKVGNNDIMRQQRASGAQVIISLCDPSWWFYPEKVRKLTDCCTSIVAGSKAERDDFLRWYGDIQAYVVPDRIELKQYPIRKEKHEHADPIKFIWYGMSNNRVSLFGALANLERLEANGVNLTLTICDNEPSTEFYITDAYPVYYVQWSLKYENSIIAEHDIALLPPYPGPWGKLKTNNKTLTAWACGLPVTDAYEYYDLFNLAMSADKRQHVAGVGWQTLNNDYLVGQSAADWMNIVEAERKRLNET